MKKSALFDRLLSYEQPTVETLDVAAEKGFAASGGNVSSDDGLYGGDLKEEEW